MSTTAIASTFVDTLRGILQKGASSPRELVGTLNLTLEIPYWEAEGKLETFLGHEIPEHHIGTVYLDGPLVILDIPERDIYHTIPV